MNLLTTANAKIQKSKDRGYLTFGLHLAPGNLSGHEVCVKRSPGCTVACLNTNGRGAFNSVQQSRIQKTQFLFDHRDAFMSLLFHQVNLAVRKARREGYIPAFRPNLTADLAWESMRHKGENLMEAFSDVQFYDYTKIPMRMRRYLNGKLPSNYHLTFSQSEVNYALVQEFVQLKGNVAVVFRKALPAKYLGVPVVDGDADDLRFLDPANVVVGLKEKGRAKADQTGFVVEPWQV